MDGAGVVLNGAKIEVARWGRGLAGKLPILLLHEGLGSVSLWKRFPEALAAATGRAVVAWSRLGHGQSGGGPQTRQIDYMHREADLLGDLLDRLDMPCAHWFGHSDGGSIALLGAARFPQRVASLVLEAPHVMVEDCTVASIAALVDRFAASDMAERMKKHHADPETLFRSWAQVWLSEPFRRWNIEADVRSITTPALLIQGTQDEYGTLAQIDRLAAILPSSTQRIMAGCSHSPHLEQPDPVLRHVAEFLDGRP